MTRTKLHAHPWLGMSLTLLALGVAAAVPQTQVRAVTLGIRAQPIGSALNEFARQSGVQVLFCSDASDGVSVPDLAGTFAPDVALTKLLSPRRSLWPPASFCSKSYSSRFPYSG